MYELDFISPYVREARTVYNPSSYRPGHSNKWLSNETENLLIYVSNGSYRHTIDGTCIDMQEGMLMIIPPYASQIIGGCISDYWELYCVYFDLFDCAESRRTKRRSRDRHLSEREMYFASHPTLTQIDETRRPALIEKLDYIKNHYKNPSLSEALMVKSFMLAVLAEFFSSPQLGIHEKKPGASLYVAEALRYVDHNYADPTLSVTGIASHLGISDSYLSRLFKQEVGTNLSDHIVKTRIAKAKDLFSLGKRISEAAAKCGFVSLQSFSRTFRRLEGISPREFLSCIQPDEI